MDTVMSSNEVLDPPARSPKTLTDLPVELCDEIASYLPPSTLSRIVLASKQLYRVFIRPLYRVVRVEARGDLILRTLAERRDLALIVRGLHVGFDAPRSSIETGDNHSATWQDGLDAFHEHFQTARRALRNLGSHEASLVELSWDSSFIYDELEIMLCAHGCFEKLKKLSLRPWSADGMNALFAGKGLEYVEYREVFSAGYDSPLNRFASAIDRFGCALVTLTTVSPQLRELKLSLRFNHELTVTQPFIQSLVSTINSLRFPCLQSFHIYIEAGRPEKKEWLDFRPFLDSHLRLRELLMDLQDLPLAVTSLPALEIFHGLPRDWDIINQGGRPISSVTFWVGESEWDRTNFTGQPEHDRLFTFSRTYPKIKKLCIIPTYYDELDERDPVYQDSHAHTDSLSVERIVRSCFHLTHLELWVQYDLENCYKSLHGLSDLEWLKLHTWQYVDTDIIENALHQSTAEGSPDSQLAFAEDDVRRNNDEAIDPSSEDRIYHTDLDGLVSEHIYPADQLAIDIRIHLAISLPKLLDIELQMEGKGLAGGENETNLDLQFDAPEFRISYLFRVIRDREGVEVRLML